MLSDHEVLQKAKEKLEQGFCTKVFARNAAGESVSPMSPEAIEWCARGAIRAVMGWDSLDGYWIETESRYTDILNQTLEANGFLLGIAFYNNDKGKDRTIAIFDKAIESLAVAA